LNDELQRDQDKFNIYKSEINDQAEAKEDFIANLEESLEQAKF